MRLAIVGIRGLPNNYGGFETLAEYLVKYLAEDIEITVYCSSKDMPTRLKTWNGAILKYIPVTSHGALGILYDSLALVQALIKYDKVLFLGFGGGFMMLFLRRYRYKMILNIGGLDWKRNKWSPFAQKVIKRAEALLVKNSAVIIADNIGIRQYLMETYGRESVLIAYGGDQATHVPVTAGWLEKYPFLSNPYAFSVCRIQPDNNIDMMLEAFKANDVPLPLVLVGNWNDSAYGQATRSRFGTINKLILLDAIYDRTELDVLRSNCTFYVHGHSAGGTNPSLAEAMFLGLPVLAFASGYNEHTTVNRALYFKDIDELRQLIRSYKELGLEGIGAALHQFAEEHYRWKNIAARYKALLD